MTPRSFFSYANSSAKSKPYSKPYSKSIKRPRWVRLMKKGVQEISQHCPFQFCFIIIYEIKHYKVTFSADADPKAVVKDPKTAKGEDYFFGGKHTINL